LLPGLPPAEFKGVAASKRTFLWLAFTAVAALAGFPSPARAQVTGYNIFKEDFLDQTDASTVTSEEWVYTANLELTNATDAEMATVTAPSSTVYSMSGDTVADPAYVYRGDFVTKSAMDAAFPSGASYTLDISGGTVGSESGVLPVPSESALPYPSAVPEFTDFSGFQNLDPAQSASFTFSGFTNIAGGPNSSLLFFNITNIATGATVFSDNFASPATTSVVVPAGTLSSDTAYSADLDYSNRETSGSTGFNGVTPFTGFDYNTSASFSTVPEPSSATMLGLVLAGGLVVAARRRTVAAA
jgi:hypothetical protein